MIYTNSLDISKKIERRILMTINVLEKIENEEQLITDMYHQISNIIIENKTKMIYQINNTLVETNYMIGKIIVENE